MLNSKELRKRREELGLTIGQAATMAGLSERAYRRWENGEVKTERGTAQQAILDAFGLEKEKTLNLEAEVVRLVTEVKKGKVQLAGSPLSEKQKIQIEIGLKAVLQILKNQVSGSE